GVASGPNIIAAGLPGIKCMIKKTKIPTMNIMGIKAKILFSI
ncbi:unnamed protein product, partial [marine sediment metagenome]